MHFFLVVLLLGASASASGQVQLVTEQEAHAAASVPMLTPRAVRTPDAPQIEIVAPDITAAVSSPTRVQLRFRTVSPSTAKPESLKALYGAFRVDITSRLLKLAKLTPEGLVVEAVALPSGSHRIFLEIEDTDGRVGTQLLSVTVQ